MKRLSLVLAATVTLAAPAVAGGPWISVELPANPYLSRGAFVIVHTYIHAQPAPFLVVGTAEGLVGGQRRSVALTVTPTGVSGQLAITKSWPSEGVWVLKLGVDGMQLGAAIGVGTDGEVAFVRVPTTRSGATRNLASAEVETLLRALEAGQPAPALQAAGWSHPEHRRQALAGMALMSGLAGAAGAQLLRRKRQDAHAG